MGHWVNDCILTLQLCVGNEWALSFCFRYFMYLYYEMCWMSNSWSRTTAVWSDLSWIWCMLLIHTVMGFQQLSLGKSKCIIVVVGCNGVNFLTLILYQYFSKKKKNHINVKKVEHMLLGWKCFSWNDLDIDTDTDSAFCYSDSIFFVKIVSLTIIFMEH